MIKRTKVIISLIALIACLSVIGTVYVITTIRPEEEKVTVGLPRVGVNGTKLVDDHNNIVRLRGVSIADPYYLAHYDYHFSEGIFAELSDWNINVVRVPIHPGWWQAEEDYSRKYLDPVVSWGEKYRFYIILDWHAIGNPLTGETQNPAWKEGRYTVYNSSLQLAESAWTELAKRYGENSSVIFELFNEPASIEEQPVDWREWRDKLTGLIDTIRTFAPNTLILVSGWQWTYDLRGFATYPIERDDIAYVAHVYPNHKEWEYYFGFLSYAHPVIVTEWGFFPTVSPTENYYGTRENFGEPFLRYMEDKNISWIAWCFHPVWQPNMITNWEFELTEEGRLVKQALVANSTLPTVLSKLPPTRLLLSKSNDQGYSQRQC
jgi:endoglucanase